MQPWTPARWAERRRELQTRIDAEQQPSEVVQLREQLNRLTALLGLLPEEVLVDIIRCFVLPQKASVEENDDSYAFGLRTYQASYSTTGMTLPEITSWLRIGHVCRYIRALVLLDPILWADQRLQGIPWTDYCLERIPAQAPLRVKGGEGIEVEQMHRLLSRSIQIRVLDLRFTAVFWRALMGLTNAYQFPILDTLKLLSTHDHGILGRIPHFLTDALARTSSLILYNFSLSDVVKLNANLRVLNIICHPGIHEATSIQHYHRLLKELPNLESFELTATVSVENNGSPAGTITLPHLRTLRLCLPLVNHYARFFAPLRLPQCTSTHVQLQFPLDNWDEAVEDVSIDGWDEVAQALQYSQIFREPLVTFHCDGVPGIHQEYDHLRLRMWTEHIATPLPNSSPTDPPPCLTILVSAYPLSPINLYQLTDALPLKPVRTLAIYNVDRVFEQALHMYLQDAASTPTLPQLLARRYTSRWQLVLFGFPHVTALHLEGSLCHVLPPSLKRPHTRDEPTLSVLETLYVDGVRFMPHAGRRCGGWCDDGCRSEHSSVYIVKNREVDEEEERYMQLGDTSLELLYYALQRRANVGFKLRKLVFGRNVSYDPECGPLNGVLSNIRKAVDEVVDYELQQQ